jgi:hypothetical protein
MKAINPKIKQGTNPFKVGKGVYYVDHDGVSRFTVHYVDQLGIHVRLWDAAMDRMIFSYEGFHTKEEAVEAYEKALEKELLKVRKNNKSRSTASVYVVNTQDEELLDAVADSCPYFAADWQGESELIVKVNRLEDALKELDNKKLTKMLNKAKQQGCSYIHIIQE